MSDEGMRWPDNATTSQAGNPTARKHSIPQGWMIAPRAWWPLVPPWTVVEEGGDEVRRQLRMDPPEPHESPGLHTALERPDDAQAMVQEVVQPIHVGRVVCNSCVVQTQIEPSLTRNPSADCYK